MRTPPPPLSLPPLEEETDEADDEEGKLGGDAETVAEESTDNAEGGTLEEEATPAEEKADVIDELSEEQTPIDSPSPRDCLQYDRSKCHYSKEAADQKTGNRVAHRYDNGVIYLGEVISALFKPTTTEDPTHFINVVKYDADGTTDEVWKSHLLKDHRLHFYVVMTYGSYALDSLVAPPAYPSVFDKFVNKNLAWTHAGDHLSERPVMFVEPPPVAVSEPAGSTDVPGWMRQRAAARDTYLVRFVGSGQTCAMHGQPLFNVYQRMSREAVSRQPPPPPS